VGKQSETHDAAMAGVDVGKSLKDTVAPSLNILIKLMTLLSVIFGNTFYRIHSWLSKYM
jgi:Na+/H+-translocating membrane pyrophosphatase